MPGGGRGGPMPRQVQVSKKLSWLLRHGAEKEGLQLDDAGYINLKDVVGEKIHLVASIAGWLSFLTLFSF
jgi:2'-phosphotransferase